MFELGPEKTTKKANHNLNTVEIFSSFEETIELSSCQRELLKKFLQLDSNPWLLQYQYSARCDIYESFESGIAEVTDSNPTG